MVIDDHVLLAVLLDRPPPEVKERVAGVLATGLFTTNCYYFRLCRALTNARTSGAFSGRLAALPADAQAEVVSRVRVLPAAIGVLPMRDLIPTMADVAAGGPHDLLALEVLAAAQHLRTEIVVAERNDNPRVKATASQLGVPYRTLAVDWDR